MKTPLLVGFYLVFALFATEVLADDIIDSGWVQMKPSELVKGVEGPRIKFSDINVLERPAIRSNALSVVRMTMAATSKVDDALYFDIDVVARDKSGEVLFVLKLGTHVFGVRPEAPGVLSQSVYVVPGTLDRVAEYQFRFIGFK